MQTFLPYGSDFSEAASVLDRQRLGKQRVEAYQIIQALTTPTYGWQNHPAVKMWRGHVEALALYGLAICDEWIRRGYKDSMRARFVAYCPSLRAENPAWIDREDIVLSHRANLVRKAPEHYSLIWPDVDPSLAYVWPAA